MLDEDIQTVQSETYSARSWAVTVRTDEVGLLRLTLPSDVVRALTGSSSTTAKVVPISLDSARALMALLSAGVAYMEELKAKSILQEGKV